MRRISNYIGKQVFTTILVVLLLVVGLDIVAALIDQLGELTRKYTFSTALVYVGLTIPGRIHEYIPLSALVGSLVAMGTLASGSELIVLRAGGLSIIRLVWFACRPVLLLIVLSVSISEFISPYTDQWAQSYKAYLRWGSERSLASSEGLWHREGDTFMHFNVVQPGGVLYGVTLFEFSGDERLSRAIYAVRATYHSNGWELEDVRVSEFLHSGIASEEISTMRWESGLSPQLLGYLALAAEDLSLSGLYDYSNYLDEQELDSGDYRLAFWQKSLHPLAVLSLVLVAMSFVFGPLRESTAGFRVFVGVIVGIAFQFAQNLLGPSSLIYGYPPLYAVLIPIAVCAFAGLFLLARTR